MLAQQRQAAPVHEECFQCVHLPTHHCRPCSRFVCDQSISFEVVYRPSDGSYHKIASFALRVARKGPKGVLRDFEGL